MNARTGGPYEVGLTLMNTLYGGQAGEQMIEAMKDICPDFANMTLEWALGGVMARPGLDLKTRELLLVASCVTLGNAAPQLRAHMSSALKLGASKAEVVEAILQMLFYAGGPAVSNALVLASDVFRSFDQPSRSEGSSMSRSTPGSSTS